MYDNAADIGAPGLARENRRAGERRDGTFSPEAPEGRGAAVVERGTSQQP
jgi:hypothetical protein